VSWTKKKTFLPHAHARTQPTAYFIFIQRTGIGGVIIIIVRHPAKVQEDSTSICANDTVLAQKEVEL
jgi:hypothetical protein